MPGTSVIVLPNTEKSLLQECIDKLSMLSDKVEYQRIALVGSRFILGATHPACDDTDVLLLVDDLDMASDALQQGGFAKGGSETIQEFWRSLLRKMDNLNILLTDDEEYYDKWVAAANVCKYLNIEDRNIRVAVHMMIMDGYQAFHFGNHGIICRLPEPNQG